MSEIPLALKIIRLGLFALIMVLALMYAIPIVCLRRFHQSNHLLTLNFCIASFGFGLHYFVSYVIFEIDRTRLFAVETCHLFMFSQMLVVAQVVLALLMISINRFFSVIYFTKPFFKRSAWVIVCLVCQWTLGFTIVIPMYRRNQRVNVFLLCTVAGVDTMFTVSFVGFVLCR